MQSCHFQFAVNAVKGGDGLFLEQEMNYSRKLRVKGGCRPVIVTDTVEHLLTNSKLSPASLTRAFISFHLIVQEELNKSTPGSRIGSQNYVDIQPAEPLFIKRIKSI